MKESLIKWTKHTWNPTTGCTVFSKECENCYAKTFTDKLQEKLDPKYIYGFDTFVEHDYTLKQPFIKWKKPTVIFVNSMSDLFHKDCSLGFLKKVFEVMNNTPHIYQVLTKRDAILVERSDQLTWTNNIWMGISVGSVASVRKIDRLRQCGAKNKFLSIEPLIEELPNLDLTGIDWVIVGGESGSGNIRPMKKEWVLKIKKNCEDQNVPFFFKQWGDIKSNPDPKDPTISKSHSQYEKGGCMLDGKLYFDNPCVVKPIIGELPF